MMIDAGTNGICYVEAGRLSRDLQNLDNHLAFVHKLKQELVVLFRATHKSNTTDKKKEFIIINHLKRLNRIEYDMEQQKNILQDEKEYFSVIDEDDARRVQIDEAVAYATEIPTRYIPQPRAAIIPDVQNKKQTILSKLISGIRMR